MALDLKAEFAVQVSLVTQNLTMNLNTLTLGKFWGWMSDSQ